MTKHTIYYTTFPLNNTCDDATNDDANLASPTSVIGIVPMHQVVLEPLALSSDTRPAKIAKVEEEWKCPVSVKASRTSKNVLQGIIQPIVENFKLGCQRADRKEPISLAVSTNEYRRY
jgi:hypothetical protein